MDILEIKNLHKSFGDKKVLNGLDLIVPEHSIFGFVGANGAGKTTTMKAVLGMIKIDEGEVHVLGKKVNFGQSVHNRLIGYLPDVPEFYPYMNAVEYLSFCAEISEMPKQDSKSRIKNLLELVGLEDETHRIKGYSRGMKQRLGIAQALLNRPRLLICDEPTSALDPLGRKEILDIISAVREETTVIFSTHILSDVERICTDLALIHGGKIQLQESLEAIKKRYRSNTYYLEIEYEADAERLMEVFAGLELRSPISLVFTDKDNLLYDILAFLSQENIALSKLEKVEASLESVFMEIIQQ